MTNIHPQRTSDRTFEQDITRAPFVLVKFGGAWCAPCVAVQPTLDAIARERSDVLVLTIDSDENPESTLRYGVRGLPTTLVFYQGVCSVRVLGNQRRNRFVTALDEAASVPRAPA